MELSTVAILSQDIYCLYQTFVLKIIIGDKYMCLTEYLRWEDVTLRLECCKKGNCLL